MGKSNAERQREYRSRRATAKPDKVLETKRVEPKAPTKVEPEPALRELALKVELLSAMAKRLTNLEDTVAALSAQVAKLRMPPKPPTTDLDALRQRLSYHPDVAPTPPTDDEPPF